MLRHRYRRPRRVCPFFTAESARAGVQLELWRLVFAFQHMMAHTGAVPFALHRPSRVRLPAPARPDEWAELPEWVEHHLKVGVGKMYILDDGSQACAHAGRGWCSRMRLVGCAARMPVLLCWCCLVPE